MSFTATAAENGSRSFFNFCRTSQTGQTEDLNNSSFLTPHSSLVRIVFDENIESITPGQSVVFYCGENYTDVLGGAILF